MTDHRQLIEAVRRTRTEDLRFFSSAAKPERERWVVSEFLRALRLTFSEDELDSPEEDDPVDVNFRDARFQVKEITEPDLRRSDELRAELRRTEHAADLEVLVEPGVARDIVLSNVYLLMLDFAASFKYPPSVRASVDLLFYVTRPYSGLGSEEERQELAAAGWRSIACLYGSRPLLLAAVESAPSFLRC